MIQRLQDALPDLRWMINKLLALPARIALRGTEFHVTSSLWSSRRSDMSFDAHNDTVVVWNYLRPPINGGCYPDEVDCRQFEGALTV